MPVPGGYRSPFDPVYDPFWGLAAEAGIVVPTHAGIDGYDAIVQMWEPGGGESSLFRSPLRGIVTKGRAVSDFLGAAVCHKVFERFPALRMAVVENGASWAPDLLHRLDDAANRNPGYFEHHPRDVFGEHVWITPFWEDDIAALVERRARRSAAARLGLAPRRGHPPAGRLRHRVAGRPAGRGRPRIGRDNVLDVLAIALRVSVRRGSFGEGQWRSGSSRARASASSGRRASPFAGRHTTPSTVQASRRSRRLSSFMLDSFGSSASTRTNAGIHFGPRSGWLAEELVEGRGVERRRPSRSSSAAMTRSPTGSSGTA